MNMPESNSESVTLGKYLSLLQTITKVENRLTWSEFTYIFLNLFVLFFIIGLNVCMYSNPVLYTSFLGVLSAMLCIVVGETLCIYWVISSMRMQLKLKLRYFQARALERKMDNPGEFIISEEYIFFDRDIKQIESFDTKETVHYPSTGAVRMDGFAGSAKPRHLSWLLPSLFFLIYCIFFILTIIRIFSA